MKKKIKTKENGNGTPTLFPFRRHFYHGCVVCIVSVLPVNTMVVKATPHSVN